MNPSVVLIAILAAAPGEHWPGFRGDGTSVSAAQKLPIVWSDDRNVVWSVEIPGYGQSSPVVWGDRVFVTSARGEHKEQSLITCFAASDGRKLWSREFLGTQKIPVSDYVSRVAPTPVVDAQRVYAFFESGDMVALDHAGSTLWQRSLVNDYGAFQGNHGIGASLAATSDSVIVLVDHSGPSFLLALDKAMGANRWKVDRESRTSWSTPAVRSVRGRLEIVVSSNGTVDGFRADTGERLWWMTGLDGNTVASPTSVGDRVVIGSSKANENLLVDGGGTGDISATAVTWRATDATSSFGSPLAAYGLVYFVNKAGVLFAVDVETGQTVWTDRLPDSCWASPVAAEDRVYFFAKGGQTIVYRGGRTPERLAENSLTVNGRIYGVAAVNGAWYLRSGDRLWRISEQKAPSP